MASQKNNREAQNVHIYSFKLTISRYFIAFARNVDWPTPFSISAISCRNHFWLVTALLMEGCVCWSLGSAWSFGVPRHTSFSTAVWQECCPVALYGSRLSTCRCPLPPETNARLGCSGGSIAAAVPSPCRLVYQLMVTGWETTPAKVDDFRLTWRLTMIRILVAVGTIVSHACECQ